MEQEAKLLFIEDEQGNVVSTQDISTLQSGEHKLTFNFDASLWQGKMRVYTTGMYPGSVKITNVSCGAPVAYDEYWDNVVLLMHFNNNLVDSSTTNGSFASDGTVGFTTTNAKFEQSVNINGTPTGGGGSNVVYSTVDNEAWNLNSSDFTMEGWMWFGGAPFRPRTLIRIANSANQDEYAIVAEGVSPGAWYFQAPGIGTYGIGGGIPAVGAWTHIAVTRTGDLYRFFVNGIMKSTALSSARAGGGAKKIFIGNSHRSFVDAHYGMIDEIRITKGIARYGNTDFELPVIELPSAGVVVIVPQQPIVSNTLSYFGL